MTVAQLRLSQPAGPVDYLTRRPSLRTKPKSSALSTAFKRSASSQDLARRSFEASNIEISVTSPCVELPDKRVGGGSTHTVFPSPSPGFASPTDPYSLDRLGRSLSLTTLGTSASSSGSDPLDSPPYDLDHLPHVNVTIRSSVTSTNTRPSMRHFPSLATLRNHRRSHTSSDEEYAYTPTPQYSERPTDDKPHAPKEGDTVSKRLRDGVGHFLGTTGGGMKRSRLLKKLKQRAGVKLSRLFSSDSEDASGPDSKEKGSSNPDGHHNTANVSGSSSGNESGNEGISGQSDIEETNETLASARADLSSRRRRRRPNMSIDLSTVSTFQTELSNMPEPRLSYPYAYRTRSGYYRYNAMPTIIGSPSIPISPPEEYHTPTSGSPILSTSNAAEPQQGLMSLAEQCHPPTERDQSTCPSPGSPSPRRNAIDLDRSDTNGSGIDPLDALPPKPILKPAQPPLEMEIDPELSIFSPSIYRAPRILAMRDTPPISPLDIASPTGLAMNPFDIAYPQPTSMSMRPISSFEMLEQRTSSSSSSHRSHSSTGSTRSRSRGKIDGHPFTASFGSAISILKPESTPAMPLDSETKAALLPRSSFDVGSPPPHPAAIAPRPSLPNVHFASPPTPTRAVFSPPLSSPRTSGSPRFAQSAFPPVSTPPSLIANPKSLGDPYPKGLSDTASQNLAGNECACGDEAHSHPHVKRRSSTKRKPSLKVIDRKGSMDVDVETPTETLSKVTEAIEIETSSCSAYIALRPLIETEDDAMEGIEL